MKIESRYSSKRELEEMFNFSVEMIELGLEDRILGLSYDSKCGLCSISVNEDFVKECDIEPIRNCAYKHLLCFDVFGLTEHGKSVDDYMELQYDNHEILININDGSPDVLELLERFKSALETIGLDSMVTSVSYVEGYSIFQFGQQLEYCIDSIRKIYKVAEDILPNVSLVPIDSYIDLNKRTRAGFSLAPN